MWPFWKLVEYEIEFANQRGRRNLTFYKGFFTDPFTSTIQQLWSWMPSWWRRSCWSHWACPPSRRQGRWGRRRCCNSCRAGPWRSWRLCPPVWGFGYRKRTELRTVGAYRQGGEAVGEVHVGHHRCQKKSPDGGLNWFNRLWDVFRGNLPGVVVGPVKDGDQSQEQERGYLSILQWSTMVLVDWRPSWG